MKYALALGGGGARGAFEAGVWSKLCEMNKEIQAVAGTSVGAVNGAAFICGADTDMIWKNTKGADIIPRSKEKDLLSPSAVIGFADDILRGGTETEPLRSYISRYVSEEKIRGSETDFGLCLYSLKKRRIKQLFKEEIPSGRMIDHITAAACFPIFKNIVIDDEEFTDGGLFNNLPVDMLIKRGYKNIISVSVGGPGYEKDFRGRGVNIIKIKYKDPEQGVMEFDPKTAERSIKLGQLECGRAFGRYYGNIFYIERTSYFRAMQSYGEDIIKSIEEAGDMIGIDRVREYTFSGLTDIIMSKYKENERLRKEVNKIERMPRQLLNKSKNKFSDSANAILYMVKHS